MRKDIDFDLYCSTALGVIKAHYGAVLYMLAAAAAGETDGKFQTHSGIGLSCAHTLTIEPFI